MILSPPPWRMPSARASRRSFPNEAAQYRVHRYDGIAALHALAEELDAVNSSSANPSPFATSDFTISFASFSERDPEGMDVRLFVVRNLEGSAVGWAVFAFRTDSLFGSIGSIDSLGSPWIRSLQQFAVSSKFSRRGGGPSLNLDVLKKFPGSPRLELMTTNDVDRPGIVATTGLETTVANAILAHLVRVERDWTMLEWRAQEPGNPIWLAARELANPFLRVRDVPLDPYSEVVLDWPDVSEYFRSLSKRMRSNVSRQARRLYASGEIDIFLVDGAEATSALFGAYADLESRSWKYQSPAAMGRHPLRKEFYSRIVSGQAGVVPSMIGIARNGVLIAALINGQFENRMWSMEMAFDESCSDLGPGQLLLLLAVMDGLEKHYESLNMFQLHGYFKRRWLAREIEVVNVQLIRRPSLHDSRGLVGDCVRWFRSMATRFEQLRSGSQQSGHDNGGGSTQVRGDGGDESPEGSKDAMNSKLDKDSKEVKHDGNESDPQPNSGAIGGFNSLKRAAEAKAGDRSGESTKENEQRELFASALENARGLKGANAGNVRWIDTQGVAKVLPFSVR